MTDAFTCEHKWTDGTQNGRPIATGVNKNGAKVMKPQYDHRCHEDATTVLIRHDGQPQFADDLDDLITSMKENMVEVGKQEYDGCILISEEREVSVAEIQRGFENQMTVSE